MTTPLTPCQQPDANPDDWFAPVGSNREMSARLRCLNDCAAYWECRQAALTEGVPHGTWGGMDERTRDRIWKKQGGRPTKFDDDLDRYRHVADAIAEVSQ
jgi:hypothetical protein